MEVIKLLRRMKQTVEQKKAAQIHELLDCGYNILSMLKYAEIMRSARNSELTLHLHSERIMINLSRTS